MHDYRGMTWVYFLKIKNHEETLDAFRTFKVIAEESSGHLIRRFHYHNGCAEYNIQYFMDFLVKAGISYKPSAPYTQNQNGISE